MVLRRVIASCAGSCIVVACLQMDAINHSGPVRVVPLSDIRTCAMGPDSVHVRMLRPPNFGLSILVEERLDGLSKYALLDTGEDSTWLVGRLSQLGVDSISLMVISHPHYDHFRGAIGLAGVVPIGIVVENGMRTGLPGAHARYVPLIGRLSQVSARVVQPTGPTVLRLFENSQAVRFVAFPGVVYGSQGGLYTNSQINNASVAVRVELGTCSLLFLGDGQLEALQLWKAQVPTLLSSTVVVAAHHGQPDARDTAFYDSAEPSVVLIANFNRYWPDPLLYTHLTRSGTAVDCNFSSGEVTLLFSDGPPQIGTTLDGVCPLL